jgi:SAM-dependent methyltransferase
MVATAVTVVPTLDPMNTGHEHDSDGHLRHQASHQMAFDSDAGVALLELEGEVFSGFTREATTALKPIIEASGIAVRRVIDLGCGPGVATCELAALLEPASVVAADASSAMLERVAARAARLGRDGQVETRRVDLDGDLRPLGSCDLVYASLSLHHVHDEVATLGQIRSMLQPHGLLCLLERADPPVVRLSDERGRPGIWSRLETAWQHWFDGARGHLPGATRTETYPALLATAGFDLEVDQMVGVAVDLSGNDAARRFAVRQLQRAQVNLVDHADAADLDALPGLVHAMSAPTGDGFDGVVSATRRLCIARPRAAGFHDT